MAITQIQDPFARGMGGQVGSQLGQVLSENLNQLAAAKSHQLKQNQLSNVFNSLGLPGQLSQVPDQERQLILKELLGEYGVGSPLQNPMMQSLMPQQQMQQAQQQMGMTQQAQPLLGMRLGSKALARMQELGKEERAQLHSLEKAERPYYDKTVEQYESSKDMLNNLQRMVKLINEGGVVNPSEDSMNRWIARLFKVPMKDLRGATTEEYEKIVNGFIKNAKQMFGGRVTNYDLESFMKTLPTLAMSHEGKMRLIGSMTAAAEAQKLKYEALKALIKENGGRIPPYASMMVNDMISDDLDKLSEAFVSGKMTPALSELGRKSAKRGAWKRYTQGMVNALLQNKGMILGTLAGAGTPVGALGGAALGEAIPSIVGRTLSEG